MRARTAKIAPVPAVVAGVVVIGARHRGHNEAPEAIVVAPTTSLAGGTPLSAVCDWGARRRPCP
jgi:hypothetical protein